MENSTIVSCFINLNDGLNKSVAWYIEKGKFLLEIDTNLVFFVDENSHPHVFKIRDDLGLTYKTHFIITKLEDFPLYKYKENIINNRKGKSIYVNNRNTPNYFILVSSKLEMMKKSIDINPFKSKYFIWIDFGIKGQKYTQKGMIEDILHNIKDKFSCCYIHYRDKNFIKNYPEFYKYGHCGIAGGVLSGNIYHIITIYNLFNQKFIELVKKGYGHGEEQILIELESDYPELFDFYNGDYSSIISNYINITQDIDTIINTFIKNARLNNKIDYAYRVCKNIECSINMKLVQLTDHQKLQFSDEYFISAWRINRSSCIAIIKNLKHDMDHSKGLCKLFESKLEHYTSNFDYVSLILPQTKNIEVYRDMSEEEINDLKKDYQIFIYKDNVEITGSYLLISNPTIRPKNNIKNIKYDLTLI